MAYRGFTLMEVLIATLLSLLVVLMLGYGYKSSTDVLQRVIKNKRENSFIKICTLMQEQMLGAQRMIFTKGEDYTKLSYITPNAQTLKSPYAEIIWETSKKGVFYSELPPYGGKEMYTKKVFSSPIDMDRDGNFVILSHKGKRCYVELFQKTKDTSTWKAW
jgi:type II secretory pathway pseudopilin PulG